MTTTAGTYIKLPTAAGADDLFAADLPLDGVAQILASNATHLSRVNSLRSLNERPGGQVWKDLPTAGVVSSFPWDEEVTNGRISWFGGRHLFQPYGETGNAPKLVVKALLQAPTGENVTMLVTASSEAGYPGMGAWSWSASTTSTSPVAVDVEIDLSGLTQPRPIAPMTGNPLVVGDEQGQSLEFYFWVGFYSSSDSSLNKGSVHSISAFLENV